MGASALGRPFVAVTIGAASACSIWAAMEDPYKDDPAGNPDVAIDAGSGAEATVDAGADARSPWPIVDAGFRPVAIAAYGDTVYLVDEQANVHVAYDAGTSFESFWTNDAGDQFLLPGNAIAASAAGVFWTATSGVHSCVDGGSCTLLPWTHATSIAASDTTVAWIEGQVGVRVCPLPLQKCSPALLVQSKNAANVAVGPNGAVAWSGLGVYLHLATRAGNANVLLSDAPSLLATDDTTGLLYWKGSSEIGFLPFEADGGAAYNAPPIMRRPTQLFVANGVAYWSLAGDNALFYCDPAQTQCLILDRLNANGLNAAANLGIVANSRWVWSVLSTQLGSYELVAWPLPKPPL